MFTHTSQTRRTMTLLSAGAAALLITGLGVFQARADNLTWNPNQSSAGGTNGNGTWNSSSTYWYDTSTSSGPVAWANGDGAYFGSGTGGSGNYTVTLGSSSGTYTPTSLTVSNSGNSYVLNGNGGTITDSGQLLANGNLTLENITLDNTAYTSNSATTTGISQTSQGATLNIGSGATLAGTDINAGGINGTGVINVNTGGTLSESYRIQINFGAGSSSGNALNVNGGSVNIITGKGAIAFLNDSNLANSASEMNVGAGGTGGTVTANQISTGGNGSGQTGTLNVDSGIVTATDNNYGSITAGSSGNSHLVTTIVNLNGGVLSVHDITESLNGKTSTAVPNTTIVNFNGGTLQEYDASVGLIADPNGSTQYTYTPASLNVLAGGAIIDTNGYSPAIYNPLLTGTSAGTPDGGLTVENSDPGRGSVSIASNGALTITGGLLAITGANTYTGPTVINTGSALQLEHHTASSLQGGVTGTATIADTSMLQIDSGGALILNPDGVGTQISVGGLTLQGGIISLGFDGSSFQSLLVGSTAAISGTNIINLADLSGGTAVVPNGTYTLISDASGGLTGTFEFGNGSTTGTLTVGTNTYTGTLNNSATAETLTVSAVPEPATLGLFAIGALSLLAGRKRLMPRLG